MMLLRTSCIALGLVLLLVSSSQAVNLLENGDFEDLTGWGPVGTFDTPEGWISGGNSSRKNPAAIQEGTAAIGGSGVSAYLPGYKTSDESERRQMEHFLGTGSTDAEWTLSMDFASSDPGSTSDRSLHMVLYPETAQYMIFRVVGGTTQDTGSLQFYTGNVAGWFQLPGFENVVNFSPDIQNSPLSHHLDITGHFDQATPTWDISLTDNLGTVTSSTDLVYWCDGVAPAQGEGLSVATFQTFVSTGDTVIDNLSISGASGEYITNGDFEDTTGWGEVGTSERPTPWIGSAAGRKNPAEIQSGATAIGGSGTSAYLPAFPTSTESLRREMAQNLEEPTGLEWSLEFDAAAVDTNDSSKRNLHFVMSLDGGSMMIFRVLGSATSNKGALQIYDQNTSSYSTISGFEECFDFSSDVTTDPMVNHISIDAHFDLATPTWDISLVDPLGNITSAEGIEFTQGNSGAGGVTRVTYQTFLSYGDSLIDNLVLTDAAATPGPGDANGDGSVDVSDLGILATNYGAGSGFGWEDADFTGDGIVDVSDLGILATNYGNDYNASAVPEPSTIVGLLVLCLAGLLVRIRRN